MIKRILLVILSTLMFGCASSISYEWKEGKWVPKTKMVNRGIGVEADHVNQKIKNSVITIPMRVGD